eukprot:scaffold591_cov372-Prasinococcus_capsulatus_cf.AAC.3
MVWDSRTGGHASCDVADAQHLACTLARTTRGPAATPSSRGRAAEYARGSADRGRGSVAGTEGRCGSPSACAVCPSRRVATRWVQRSAVSVLGGQHPPSVAFDMRGFGKGRRGGRTENARKGGTAGGGRVQHVKIHRQAAAFVHKLVVADATKRKGVSVKTLTLGDASVVNPKATYALTVETLRYLSLLEQLVEAAGGEEAICGERHLPPQLLHVLIYDTIFGQGCLPVSSPSAFLLAG